MKKTSASVYNPTSPAVEQAARLLLCLGRSVRSDMGLTAICREIGIHKSKCYSILNALARYDLVTKNDQTKTYCLGPALMPLAQRARERFDITAVARDHLQALAEQTRSCVLLGIICNDRVYITGKYDGNDMMSVTVHLYQSLPITHGSHGKAIFGYLGAQERQRIMDSGQVFFHGDPEHFDPARLETELRFCRENGYAVDYGEMSHGINAVSAPIFDHDGDILAALVIVGTFPVDRCEQFGRMAADAGQILSRQAGRGDRC